nr:hypothetical protein [Bacteroidota bacterium]
MDAQTIWENYCKGKQTYQQLAKSNKCSIRTIQRKIDTIQVQFNNDFSNLANVIMDTTYFGRKFGIMVFKNDLAKEILYTQFVKQETNLLYLKGIEEIARRGIKIQSITCDGRMGLMQIFKNIPVQMCNFHQVAIVRRYLTKNPKLQASKELWTHTLLLVKTDKESFEGGLNDWFIKWEFFLNERKVDASGKKRFTHKRLRSAYRSLKNNLPYLFTWYNHIDLNIPNTTNALDGQFADLKNKLRNHNGLSEKRKKKFIVEFFKGMQVSKNIKG